MSKKNPKTKRAEAERAAEHFAVEVMSCAVTRRAIRAKYFAVDFWGSDVMGKTQHGNHVYIQVTTGQNQAVQARRKKLENIPWLPSDRVLVLQLVQTPNPNYPRRKQWFFRVWEYEHSYNGRKWRQWDEAVRVKPEWWKALKRNSRG